MRNRSFAGPALVGLTTMNALAWTGVALAQTATTVTATTTSIDLTTILVALIGGFFTVLATVVSLWITSRMKDQAAAATIADAVKNSLGAIQQAATSEIQQLHPHIPGVPMALAPGVQYVLDHAGTEADRLGITPAAIASKVEAQIGLKEIDNNIAISGNATDAVKPPLAK